MYFCEQVCTHVLHALLTIPQKRRRDPPELAVVIVVAVAHLDQQPGGKNPFDIDDQRLGALA